MGLNSINTNIAAYYAQSNIGKASTMSSSSIARLSSGDRIVRASDDVAAMSAGTSLRTNVTTLRMALINTSQGSSLLQVADGALSQVTDILQRQKAIAVQAGSGSLSDAERGFLNQEFQNLSQEIDRLVSNTNFNGVTLLDGSLTEQVDVTANDTAASQSSIRVTFTDFNGGLADGENITINGVTIDIDSTPTDGLDVAPGANNAQTLQNVADYLNGLDRSNIDGALTEANLLTLTSASYSVEGGNTLVITAKNGGSQGDTITVATSSTSLVGSSSSIEGAVNGAGGTTTFNLLAANALAVANITDAATTTGGNAAAITPFEVGTLQINTNGGGNVTVATLADGDSLQDIVNKINDNTATTGFSARIIGASGAYNIQFETDVLTQNGSYDLAGDAATFQFNTAGALGGGISTISSDANVTGTLTVGTANAPASSNFYAIGGDDAGIGAGDTVGFGSIGDAIIAGQNQTLSEVQLVFGDIADADLEATLNTQTISFDVDNDAVGLNVAPDLAFTFTTNTENNKAATEITIGATLAETLDNAVSAINAYQGSGSESFALNQMTAIRDGNSIVFQSVDVGATTLLDSNAANAQGITVASTLTAAGDASVTNGGVLDNGATDGVSTSGITNNAFVGNIINNGASFSATQTGTDTVSLSITVGDRTYSGTAIPTNVTADSIVRLQSAEGDYFDIELQANQGVGVTSQADADVFAQRLDAAIGALEFSQTRTVTSYTGGSAVQLADGSVTGSLIGTEVKFQGTDFSNVAIEDVQVVAPVGSSENATITMTINGEEYTSLRPIGDQLAANQTYRFTSATDENKYLEFTTGDTAIQLDTQEKADAFETAFQAALGVGDGSANLRFQVGVTTQDTLQVGIGSIDTDSIFNGASLDVLTAENAAIASDAIDAAIDAVTSVRADVGALQSRFDFAAANVESSIQNQDAARGVLLDTDVAAESTAYATAQVQLQAGISVLAQANLLPQNLLKLIG